jgi:hypothetical protein
MTIDVRSNTYQIKYNNLFCITVYNDKPSIQVNFSLVNSTINISSNVHYLPNARLIARIDYKICYLFDTKLITCDYNQCQHLQIYQLSPTNASLVNDIRLDRILTSFIYDSTTNSILGFTNDSLVQIELDNSNEVNVIKSVDYGYFLQLQGSPGDYHLFTSQNKTYSISYDIDGYIFNCIDVVCSIDTAIMDYNYIIIYSQIIKYYDLDQNQFVQFDLSDFKSSQDALIYHAIEYNLMVVLEYFINELSLVKYPDLIHWLACLRLVTLNGNSPVLKFLFTNKVNIDSLRRHYYKLTGTIL